MKRLFFGNLAVLLLVGIMLVTAGCASGQASAETKSASGSVGSVGDAQTSVVPAPSVTPTPSPSPSPVPTETPAPTPAAGSRITVELAQDGWNSMLVSGKEGAEAPGGIKEFYAAHPDFIVDRSNRMQITSPKKVKNPSEYVRLYPNGYPPEEDMLNRERLALFVENFKKGTADSIIILSTGGHPIPLWFTEISYDGGSAGYTVQSCFLFEDKLEWQPKYTASKLEETDKEWIMLNDPMQHIRYPKYGYEPITLGEVTGEHTEDEVQEVVEQLRKELYPQTDSVVPREQETVDGVPCYVFELHQVMDGSSTYTGYSFAVAKDLSRYYEIEQVNGQWVLQARPKAAA